MRAKRAEDLLFRRRSSRRTNNYGAGTIGKKRTCKNKNLTQRRRDAERPRIKRIEIDGS